MVREKQIELKSQLTLLLLGSIILAGSGCCCVNPGAVDAWDSLGYHPYYAYYVGPSDLAVVLSGGWVYNDCFTSISVAPDGRTLIITDESGQRSSGYVAGNREIIVPVQAARGHVDCGAIHITWSNGKVWTRSSRSWYSPIIP